jgi:hypothetical protein
MPGSCRDQILFLSEGLSLGITFLFLEGFGPCEMNLAWQGQTEDASADMMQIWRWFGWSQLLHEDTTLPVSPLFPPRIAGEFLQDYCQPAIDSSANELRSNRLNKDRQKQVLLWYKWQDCTGPEKENNSRGNKIKCNSDNWHVKIILIHQKQVILARIAHQTAASSEFPVTTTSPFRLSLDLQEIIKHVMMYSCPISS